MLKVLERFKFAGAIYIKPSIFNKWVTVLGVVGWVNSVLWYREYVVCIVKGLSTQVVLDLKKKSFHSILDGWSPKAMVARANP